MQEPKLRDANKPNAINSIFYEIDIHAEPPSQEDLAHLKRLWLRYGAVSSLASALSLLLLYLQMGNVESFWPLALILASANFLASAGLAFAMCYSGFDGVRVDGAPSVDAVSLACENNPEANS